MIETLEDPDVLKTLVTEILRKVPVWAGLKDESLENLAAEFQVVQVAAGEIVFNEGDPGDSMYVIATGMARVHLGERDIKKLGPSAFFGEMALFDDAPRTASVSAIEDLVLLRLNKDAFLELLQNRIEVALGMLHEFSRRLSDYLRTINGLRDFVEKDLLPLGVALSSEKSLERLLPRILDEARRHCGADSGAIYLLNGDHLDVAFTFRDSQGLGVSAASGREMLYPPVRLYRNDGKANLANVVALVGHEGRSVNLPDVYKVDQFEFSETRALDAATGYRSQSCLTVPLKNHSDEVIGAVQLLNVIDPESGAVVPFGAYEQLVVESLSSLAAVALNTERLLDRQREFLKVEHDLEIGRQIQMDFLPEQIPQPPGWEIDARFHPARQVGGDFYDAFPTGGGRIAFVMADVCDKGVGAALYMALSRSLIRAFVWQDGLNESAAGSAAGAATRPSIDAALRPVELANRYLTSFHLKMNMFVTMFFGLLDPATGVVHYVNAGHNAPVLLTSDGNVKARLQTTSPALGMIPGARFKAAETTMEPGDSLVAFTDGVTEARCPLRTFYTDDRLIRLLRTPRASARGLLDQIEEDVKLHVAGAEPSDDITMLAIRREP